jgi:hypothetical protein
MPLVVKKKVVKKKSKIHCVWALMCSDISIDQQRNNLSLFNVIDELTLPAAAFSDEPKGVMLQHFVISQWRRILNTSVDSQEVPFEVCLELVDSNEKVLQRIVAQHSFPQGKRNLRVCMNFPGVFVTKPGDYVYRLTLRIPPQENFEYAHEVPLEVKAN